MNAFVFIEPFPPQVSWISPRFFYASTVGYHPAVPVDESSWYLDLGHPWYHAKFDIFRVWECLEEKMGKLPENVLPKIMQTAYSILPPPSLAYWRNTSLWVCMGWYHWDEKLRQYSFIVTDGVSVSLTSLFPIASLPPHPTLEGKKSRNGRATYGRCHTRWRLLCEDRVCRLRSGIAYKSRSNVPVMN